MSYRRRVSADAWPCASLLRCRYCRRYAAQIRAIGEAARGLFGQTTDSGSLEDLKARILSQAPKGDGTGNGVT